MIKATTQNEHNIPHVFVDPQKKLEKSDCVIHGIKLVAFYREDERERILGEKMSGSNEWKFLRRRLTRFSTDY